MRRLTIAALVAAVSVPICARAGPPPIPDPTPNFAPIAYLIGTWSCRSGHLGGPMHPLTTEYTYALDGRWIHEHTVSPAHDSSRNFPYVYESNTGYDPIKKRWVQIGFSNTGSYDVDYAPVAADGTLAYSGTSMDGARVTSDHGTWTSISPTEMRYSGADSTGAKYVQRCTKVAR